MRQLSKRLFRILVMYGLSIVSFSVYSETINLSSVDENGSGAFAGELLVTDCAKTGVVLFHGRGATPTGPVVEELRNSLNRAGYTTLSIENPKPLNGLTDFQSYVDDIGTANFVFPESYARMRAAINYLQSLGIEEVVIAGFSLGSRLATAHVARGQIDELPIVGLIGVGMYGTSIEPLNITAVIDEVAVPVVDIYGDTDANAVNTASARLLAYNTGVGLDYTQTPIVCIPALNCHQLEGLKGDDSKVLEINVNAWMQAVAPASLVPGCSVANTTPPVTLASDGGALNFYLTLLLLLILPVLRVALKRC